MHCDRNSILWAALQYVVYFRFYGWRHICGWWPGIGDTMKAYTQIGSTGVSTDLAARRWLRLTHLGSAPDWGEVWYLRLPCWRLSFRNASAAVSCLEMFEFDQNSKAYIRWLALIGVADANVHMCSCSEMRRGENMLKPLQWTYRCYYLLPLQSVPSVLFQLGVRKSTQPVKNEWRCVGVVICLERGAGFLGCPGKEAIKWV